MSHSTPETDAVAFHMIVGTYGPTVLNEDKATEEYVPASFARSLEQQRDALRKMVQLALDRHIEFTKCDGTECKFCLPYRVVLEATKLKNGNPRL